MLTLNNVSFEFGGRFLYQGANLDVQPGDKIGLIGRNGTGKSTLLRLMAGEYTPTEGTLTRANNLKLGFLNQDLLAFSSDKSVFEVALAAFEKELQLQDEINLLLNRMEVEYTDQLVEDLGEKQHEFERLGGYEMESKTAALLAGLGFDDQDQRRPFETFSGGWRMRAILARILLQNPDLLLLDEPTNHLDLPSIEWLENYLAKSPAAYILVSHDRFFLNRMIRKTVEISHGKLHTYAGDYEFYLQEKELRKEIQQAAYDNQQKYIQESERFIERFRAKATKASQAQSRIKLLDKLDRVEAPESEEAQVHFSFQPGIRPGVEILALLAAEKAYAEKQILHRSSATIHRGDKIGLIGPNGVGKSTVLRILANAEVFAGDRKLGYNVREAFFAQHQLEALNLNNSILEECAFFALQKGETYVRSILGGFLFTGDDVHKKIKVLSGGERSRVALAKTLLSEANFLLLDEPTNHLDMQSIQILAQALAQYQGTFILVSHDRHFLRLTANKIWFLEDQQIKEYPGTYADYEAWAAKRAKEQSLSSSKNGKPAPVAAPQPAPTESKEARQRQSQLKKSEAEIESLEQQLGALEVKLQEPAHLADYAQLQAWATEKERLQQRLNTALQAWEKLAEQVAQLV